MKKLYSTKLLIVGVLLITNSLKAQTENSGAVENDGGILDNYPIWTNTADGTYLGSNNGIFNHYGPAGQTFINNGVFQASLGHKDVFKGPDALAGTQEIAGNKRPEFFNVDFDNGMSSALNITNVEGIGVSGNLNFLNGITTTLRNLHQAAAIRFNAGGVYTNANTDAQHVNGYVSKIGNTAFTFPVGSGNDLRSVQISAPANASAHISVAWIAGDPSTKIDPSDASAFHSVTSLNGSVLAVSKLGQWDWVSVVPPTNAITVTVSVPDVSAFTTVSNLRLVGWNGTQWVDLSGSATASGVIENSTLQGTIPINTTITALGMGSVGPALPVRLVSFTAEASEKTAVLLNWKTASELNNDYFQIEHSLDAQNFKAVGQVKGKGTLSTDTDYSFLHKLDIPGGNHYYRLKQTDLDGTFAYSQIRSVKLPDPVTLIYPNPATDKINIEIADWKILKAVELFDISGRRIYQSGDKKPILKIDSRFFVSGIYTVRIKYANGTTSNQNIAVSN